jgi:hypothetical protein
VRRVQRQSRNRTAGSSKRRVEESLNAGVSRVEEGGMGGIRKSDQARQEGSGMLMFAAPSIIRDEGRNVYAGNRA